LKYQRFSPLGLKILESIFFTNLQINLILHQYPVNCLKCNQSWIVDYRNWTANQSVDCTNWTANQSVNCRNLTANQSVDCRNWTANQSVDCRNWTANQSVDCRNWTANQSADCRNWTANQSVDCRNWTANRENKWKSLIGPNLAGLFKRECRHSGYRGIKGIQYMSFQLRLRINKN